MPSQNDNDLSAAELQRLQNIKRNEDFLATLGISAIKTEIKPTKTESSVEANLKKRKRSIKEKAVESSSRENGQMAEPRRSSRLKGLKPTSSTSKWDDSKSDGVAEEEEESAFAYSYIPVVVFLGELKAYFDLRLQESYQLDDYEFKVFVALKSWRLKTCRALEIEPYKVFQNRTLCEMIRRRRNNPSWATNNYDPSSTILPQEGSDYDDSDSKLSLADQLMMCWGVGPAKVRKDEDLTGFAYGALDVLDDKISQFSNETDTLSVAQLLQRSRDLPNAITA